jgi:RNA polymerase sigma factor (sigma-70 family)
MTNIQDDRDHGDEALLEAALAGSDQSAKEDAAAKLLGRYQRRVYLWCFRLVRDHEHAVDLAQDVLISAWRHLDSYSGRSRFSSWLFAVARNRCLSELRRPTLAFDPEFDLEDLRDQRRGPEQELLERQDEEALLDLIRDELAPVEQEALWLRCFEGVPVETITEILDVREASGARSVLQRARRKLRSALRRRNGLTMGAE